MNADCAGIVAEFASGSFADVAALRGVSRLWAAAVDATFGLPKTTYNVAQLDTTDADDAYRLLLLACMTRPDAVRGAAGRSTSSHHHHHHHLWCRALLTACVKFHNVRDREDAAPGAPWDDSVVDLRCYPNLEALPEFHPLLSASDVSHGRWLLPPALTRVETHLFSRVCAAAIDFSACVKLAELPDGFFYEAKVGVLLLPPRLLRLGNFSLAQCRSGRVAFPPSLIRIGRGAFHTSAFDVVDLSACTEITTLPDGAFEFARVKRALLLPPRLTTVGRHCFFGTSTPQLELPASVTSLGPSAFEFCDVRHVDLSACVGLTVLPESAFAGAKIDGFCHLPDSIRTLNRSCFTGAKCSRILAELVVG